MTDIHNMQIYSSASTSGQQAVWNIDSVLIQPSYVSQRTVLDTEEIIAQPVTIKIEQTVETEVIIHFDTLAESIIIP